ncbi:MAG TPA: hypothetical protein VFB72_19120 [Verrucomicrobiae bacterium]|nr:hypothetical protein [Verrucomicrobiae bacterium]
MRSKLLFFLFVAAMFFPLLSRSEGLDWADDRLLPKFSTPAPVLDCVDLGRSSGAEVDLLASLEGLVNRQQPRLACVSRRNGEGKFTWLDLHNLHYQMLGAYDALLKYRTNATGLVVTDPDQPDTLNLATTMAGVNNELICDPSLLPDLTNAPYNFRVVDDLRGRFADKYAVYGFLYSNYWPKCTHRIFAGMGLRAHGSLRDYLVATKTATVWLGPGNERDAQLLRLFLSDMQPVHGLYMGWWPGEGDGLEFVAQYGIPVLASDFFCNATVFSAVQHQIKIPTIPAVPPLENKIYVALIISDGDNVQYMQHAMKMQWDKPVRGTIPIGWTTSPLAVDLDPMMLDYYWSSATTNDCLISGPSGAGYAHINHWSDENIEKFAKISAPYLERGGQRVVTIWDKVTPSVARAFAENCTNLFGLTDQSGEYTGVNHGLRTIRLTPTYTSTVREMVQYIAEAAKNFDGTAPVFIAAQCDVWHLGPTDLVQVARQLDPAKYKLVRPDQLFILADMAAKRHKTPN